MRGRADSGEEFRRRLEDELRRRGMNVETEAQQQTPGASRVHVDPDGNYRVTFSTAWDARPRTNHFPYGHEAGTDEASARRRAADEELRARADAARETQRLIREQARIRENERVRRLVEESQARIRARERYDRLPPVEPLPLLRVPCTRGAGTLTRSAA